MRYESVQMWQAVSSIINHREGRIISSSRKGDRIGGQVGIQSPLNPRVPGRKGEWDRDREVGGIGGENERSQR